MVIEVKDAVGEADTINEHKANFWDVHNILSLNVVAGGRCTLWKFIQLYRLVQLQFVHFSLGLLYNILKTSVF